jgi:meiosis-specific transcription factor NDT80
VIVPDVQAQVEKGFFQDKIEGKWTCYRRNYFSVGCSYTLAPNIDGGQIYVKRNGNQERVKAIAIRISAAVDGQNGKSIELVQHTPKRDAGPKMRVKPVRMLPKPSNTTTQQIQQPLAYGHAHIMAFHPTGQVPAPTLSLQFVVDPEPSPEPGTQTSQASNAATYSAAQPQQTNPGHETTHTFERIQFKCATANNGKRRASQQYFHLIAELLVDLRKHDADQPAWHTIAKRTSGNIVVRGRSPSHYQMEGGATGNGRGNTGAGGRYSSTAAGGMPNAMGYGSMGQGQIRSPGMGASATTGAAVGYSSMSYGSNLSFRPQSSYAPHESSGESASSPDSVNADAFDADHHPTVGMMSHSDRSAMHEMDGYSYHPSPIYDPVHLPRPRTEGPLRETTDPRHHAFRLEFPDGSAGSQYHFSGPFGRFQGLETSRNVFPDASGGGASYS